ncbi:hypothetical protein BST11_25895 [Mycobacterium alsense]|uniref:Uncharacterized protein n=1 Tax=Mycobacterium alsense TaxID=324058 RepID=A0ABX3R1J5_9MYCO|nr:hypothetical protein BST11_25895 [Mycobacterium alsense]
MRAGKALRARVDAILEAKGAADGKVLAWDPLELAHIEAAVVAADHAELLQRRLDAELERAEPKDSLLASLSAEIRRQRSAITEHMTKVPLLAGVSAGKSVQHQSAAAARWGAGRPMRRVK